MSNIISQLDVITDYLEETEFYSSTLKNFLQSAKTEAWPNEIFFNKLVDILKNSDDLMGASVIFDFWTDIISPTPQQAQTLVDVYENKLKLKFLAFGNKLGTKEIYDEMVNGILLLAKIFTSIDKNNQNKVKKLIEKIELMGVSEIVRSKLDKRIGKVD